MKALKIFSVFAILTFIWIKAPFAKDVCKDLAKINLVAGCSELAARHQPSELNSTFPYEEDMNFDEYVSDMKGVIRDARKKASHTSDDHAIEANSPFHWKPDPELCPEASDLRGGVLLVHGLTDSPYLMRDVGERFKERCFTVRSVVLPGHGTVPGDLLEIDYEEWLKAVSYGIRSFENDPGTVLVIGFSTGAAAALHSQLDADTTDSVDGLILLSPAIKPKSRWAFMANWYKLRRFFKSEDEFQPDRWLEVAADSDDAKYESFPKNAGDQIHKLSSAIRKLGCENLNLPVFMAISLDDQTVDAESAVDCFDKTPDVNNKLLAYTNGEGSSTAKKVFQKASHSDYRIIDFSHTAIPVAPSNPHYGVEGDYRNCMHYLGDEPLWAKCKSDDTTVMLGEISDDNLEKYTMRRLTFNPHFEEMMKQIDLFVDKL